MSEYEPSWFRRKPVMEQAMQFDGTHECAEALHRWSRGKVLYDNESMFVETMEGPLRFRAGWWIVQGTQGEFWAVAPEAFTATREVVT